MTNNNIVESNNPEVFGTGKEISRRQFLETTAGSTAFTALGIGMAADLFAAANPTTASTAITPFTIDVPQNALDDLKRRLDLTRWPNLQTVSDWSQGVPLEKARVLVEYWRTQYDGVGQRRRSTVLRNMALRSMESGFTLSMCGQSTRTRDHPHPWLAWIDR